MAGLNGKITIERALRPCIVHVPEEREYFYEKRERKCRVKKSAKDVKALFHCWDFQSELLGASPLMGGHPGGQVTGMFAIVEYEDGTIHEVEAKQIRFVDNPMCGYVFPEMEPHNGNN